MPVLGLRLRLPTPLRLPRRTARLRLTALYGGLFLLSGVALLGATYVLFERATAYTKPQLPTIPHTPALQGLGHLPTIKGGSPPLVGGPQGYAGAPAKPSLLTQFQNELAKDQQFAKALPRLLYTPPQLAGIRHQLAGIQRQLTQDQGQLTTSQHQLTHAVDRLAQAEHQVAQTGSVEAAQRATDSHQLLVDSGIALAIVILLALLAAWLIAGRILRPIRTITRTARRISSDNLHERLALDGPKDELKELGDTLDELFGRLEAAFEAQRHFVANASHELRTPITAERNLLQVALDDPDTSTEIWRSTAEELLASNDEQKQLIEALLTLASSESELTAHETLDLAPIVEAAVIDFQPESDRLGLHVEEVTAPARLEGDPLLVERLVANLLKNAVCHNIPGGRLEIVTRMEDGKAVLSVTNSGPLIPPNEIDRLFQPFQRLDSRRVHYKEGHGLGLSIVRAIANSHSAGITACPMPGGGLTVSVAFPRPTGSGHAACKLLQGDRTRPELQSSGGLLFGVGSSTSGAKRASRSSPASPPTASASTPWER